MPSWVVPVPRLLSCNPVIMNPAHPRCTTNCPDRESDQGWPTSSVNYAPVRNTSFPLVQLKLGSLCKKVVRSLSNEVVYLHEPFEWLL